MSSEHSFDISGNQVDLLVSKFKGFQRILLWGEMGVGKSTLAIQLLKSLTFTDSNWQIIELDPGTPPFGIPGAICRGWWSEQEEVEWSDCQALCSLNASRFRLPLILAAQALITKISRVKPHIKVLIDPPGVVRGVGGAELLLALVESLDVDLVIVLCREKGLVPLYQELECLEAKKIYIAAAPEARRPGRIERFKSRTKLWDSFLENADQDKVQLDKLRLLGTPPPVGVFQAWQGRQVALLDGKGVTLGMGEVIQLQEGELTLQLVKVNNKEPKTLLVRDAGRDAAGRFATIAPLHRSGTPARRREPQEMTPPVYSPEAGFLPVSSHLGPAWATLVGGVFGDPLLHVRLRELKKSYLFDLGDPARLSAKIAHQVEAVFLSHAHLDHIGGFIWFLRSRIGQFAPCRIFGPPGTITHIENLLGGINWDRIGDKGPIFQVGDIHGNTIRWARLQPGKLRDELPLQIAENGVILSDEYLSIKAIICDHKTPSIAYSLVFSLDVKVRKDRLATLGLSPGPWLGQLKYYLGVGTPEVNIELPDGTNRTAGELADELVYIQPGKKLVYAADMADTSENRSKLVDLAKSAHTLFCETAFSIGDRDKAIANQHLTTMAAVEIARQAGVERLVPYHFSKRYQHTFPAIYEEILAAAGPVKIIGHFSFA